MSGLSECFLLAANTETMGAGSRTRAHCSEGTRVAIGQPGAGSWRCRCFREAGPERPLAGTVALAGLGQAIRQGRRSWRPNSTRISCWTPGREVSAATIRGAVALQRKDPKRAIELLRAASAIELGEYGHPLSPVYLRGEAYLMLHDGNWAAAEFQKFLDPYTQMDFAWGDRRACN